MIRPKLNVSKTIFFDEDTVDRIQKEADRLNTTFSAVIRDCVQNDLPKFRERHKKRKKRDT